MARVGQARPLCLIQLRSNPTGIRKAPRKQALVASQLRRAQLIGAETIMEPSSTGVAPVISRVL